MIDTVIVDTNGPGMHEITSKLGQFVAGQDDGVLTAHIRHTSASLLIQENADPDVQHDLLEWLDRAVPQANSPAMSWVTHRVEGPDDMAAHIKATILPVSLSIPVRSGRMMLGRWQGVYVVEHRAHQHRREVTIAFTRA
ncbi:secondary thiamine-phosphate synthase enzyme YjbQ [Paracoccus aerodenitrificans]|uniref:secondary thiamine-phosphate synthase enzyme YjbQ n=1 Tax=Paracoccus aerodenitrificans TaxID=3017781 RepID=UPI0022F00C31|nr:secondary thiamine-phosphate synthase enzyme YjbQ [Paracoccus aerodenitrificans]WBU65153.1 secondary thiamine-phosphate synthase enzyme YjbQ [Paracoccus aerodenitrificans]